MMRNKKHTCPIEKTPFDGLQNDDDYLCCGSSSDCCNVDGTVLGIIIGVCVVAALGTSRLFHAPRAGSHGLQTVRTRPFWAHALQRVESTSSARSRLTAASHAWSSDVAVYMGAGPFGSNRPARVWGLARMYPAGGANPDMDDSS